MIHVMIRDKNVLCRVPYSFSYPCSPCNLCLSSHVSLSDENVNENGGSGHYSMGSQNLESAQGKAGKD
ncbi:hypothetical protein DVH24_037312 [Malus domestica]|uniref:Uncharacterized protein n=1 Tax=Malus domestica TaxID=3750 RepID=A0A498HDJ5_MALDO|nr:hypothetical protein DVH24_037312 [Malus domestica]